MTEGLRVEPINTQHAGPLFRALDFESVYQFLTSPRPKNSGEVSDRIVRVIAGPGSERAEVWLNFVVSLDGEIIGRLEATVFSTWAEVAYLFNPKVSGNGYATEGTLWLIDYICQSYGVTEYWATTDPNNLKSIRLLLRCGFKIDSLPAHGIRSYDEGDAVFGLRQTPRPSDNMTP